MYLMLTYLQSKIADFAMIDDKGSSSEDEFVASKPKKDYKVAPTTQVHTHSTSMLAICHTYILTMRSSSRHSVARASSRRGMMRRRRRKRLNLSRLPRYSSSSYCIFTRRV